MVIADDNIRCIFNSATVSQRQLFEKLMHWANDWLLTVNVTKYCVLSISVFIPSLYIDRHRQCTVLMVYLSSFGKSSPLISV